MNRLRLHIEDVEVESFPTGVDEMRCKVAPDAIITGAHPLCTRLTQCPCTPRAAE